MLKPRRIAGFSKPVPPIEPVQEPAKPGQVAIDAFIEADKARRERRRLFSEGNSLTADTFRQASRLVGEVPSEQVVSRDVYERLRQAAENTAPAPHAYNGAIHMGVPVRSDLNLPPGTVVALPGPSPQTIQRFRDMVFGKRNDT
jgi:hypothetical protein